MRSRSIVIGALGPSPVPEERFPCLAPLAPIGEGRGDLESLYSYLSRLVKEHSLPVTRLWNVLSTASNAFHFNKPNRLNWKHIYLVSGLGRYAQGCSEAISGLTRQVNARAMTYLALQEVIDFRGHGVLADHVKWCPECWREDKDLGIEGYVRLAWHSGVVKVCPVHQAPLETHCPKCKRIQQSSIWLPVRRACNHCGSRLDVRQIAGRPKRVDLERELWMARAIESLVVMMPKLGGELFSAQVSRSGIRAVCEQLTEGDMVELEKRLGFKNRILQQWENGDRKPTFHTLMELCYRLDLPPDQFLLYTDNLANPIDERCSSRPRFARKKAWSERPPEVVATKLHALLGKPWDGEPLLKDVAKKLGVTTSYLRYHFPDQVRCIADMRANYRNAARESQGQERINRVENALRAADSCGLYPSDRHLRMVSDLSIGDLRVQEVKSRVMTSRGLGKAEKT